MYKLLLVLASAQALKRPQRALAVRGGEIDPIAVGKGVVLASGLYGAFDPKGNLDKYGIKAEAKGQAAGRCTAWMQITTAAIFAADSEKAIGLSGYYAAWCLIASAPATKAVGFPDWCIYGWAAVCAALGAKTLSGDVSPWVLVAVWGLNGLQQKFMQDTCIELYGANKQSKLGKSMMGISGQSMLMTATYIGALAQGKSATEAFALSWIVGGALVAVFAFTEAEGLGAPKTGPLVWAAISAGIAYLCNK